MNTPGSFKIPPQSDEINFKHLFHALWRGKFTIISTIVLFGFFGVVYVLFAEQQWSAKALIAEPIANHVVKIKSKFEYLAKITNDKYFLDIISAEKLLTRFVQSYDSFDNKIDFIDSYASQGDDKGKIEINRTYYEAETKRIVAIKSKTGAFFTVSYAATNSRKAKERLNTYLDFIQAKEMVSMNDLLASEIANQIKIHTLLYQTQKADALTRLKDEIKRTEYALQISKAAGVENPIENLENENMFPIDLGTKVLTEKLKILKEIKDPEIIDPLLANYRQIISSLQAIPQERISFSSYSYQQSVLEPLARDKPRRKIVVISTILVGLMLGIFVVLNRPVEGDPVQEKWTQS